MGADNPSHCVQSSPPRVKARALRDNRQVETCDLGASMRLLPPRRPRRRLEGAHG